MKKNLNTHYLFFYLLTFIFACQNETLNPPKVTLNKISNTLNKQTKESTEDRREGPHNFLELHHKIRTRTGDAAPRYTTNYKQKAFQKALKANKTRGIQRNNLDWIERGPGNIGGRTRAILVDKRDATNNTWLAGSAGGGIWKTEDGNQSYRLVSEELPNMSTSTLASSPANPEIVYAGTGEGFDEQGIKGDGIYKSSDGGENWTLLEATANNPAFENVLRLVVNPADPNELLAATRADFRMQPDTTFSTETGFIMKSTDGGQTWYNVYSVKDNPAGATSPAVQQIIADPNDFSTLYAAVRGVAILKSIDKGETWTMVYDASIEELGRIEIAVSPVNTQVVFFAAENAESLATLYRSEDAGTTWELININENPDWFATQGWYDNTIAAHPYDENTVFVAGAGPMLSVTVSDETAPTAAELGEVQNNTDFLKLFNPLGGEGVITTEEFMTTAFGVQLAESPTDLINVEVRFGEGKKQKAHRHAFSEDFTNSYLDYVEVPFEVWDIDNNRQLMVSFLDFDENNIWNLVEIGMEDLNNLPELLSIHALDYDTLPSPELNGFVNQSYYTIFGGQDFGSEVDGNNLPEGNLLIQTNIANGLIATFLPITDGYGQFSASFENSSTKGVHVDHHNILLIPTDAATQNFYVINANDGGVAFSKDAGATFLQTGDTFKEEVNQNTGDTTIYETSIGYNTSQFYGADKMNGADRYIGGTQDNGSWVSPIDAAENSIWVVAPSGDGFEAAWHYTNPNLILESSQFNNIYRSDDGGATWNQLSLPGTGPFLTRVEASKQDPDLVFAISSEGVLRSADFGLSWTSATMPEEWVYNGFNNSVKVSLAAPNIVWSAGSVNEFERIAVSTDGGFTFNATNGYNQAVLGAVTGLGTHPLDKNTAFALFSIADAPKILKTTDLGVNWTDISGFGGNQAESDTGFPDVATYSILVMPFDTNQIWVGTEIGLFESLDGGASWNFADNGLPPVAIWEMKIVNDEVVLATHGRGLWSVSLPELAGYEPIEAVLSPLVTVSSNGFNNKITGLANLRGAYDSTILKISVPISAEEIYVEQLKISGNDAAMISPFDLLILQETDTFLQANIEVISYMGTETLKGVTSTLIYDVEEEPVIEYTNDFNEGQTDFVRLGFNVFQADGFEDAALHSPHPYPDNNGEIIALLKKPIEVTSSNPIFSYNEVVLVEPGDSPDFGTPEFYDYVTVEGTLDNGENWYPLDGYDSNRNADWLAAFQAQATGSTELIRKHSIDLSEFLEEGTVIYLRFRLFSDSNGNGWGWMIDDIAMESATTSVEELPVEIALKNYPNPFSHSAILEYNLPEKSEVSAALFSLDGKKIEELIHTTQNAGVHTYQVNTSRLESGVYICRFVVNGTEKTLKWIKQ